ncbi:Regulatory protein wetA [Cyphellophora attinorum]|uniref:Regulatory protein wetA n=1 Tax=Cyphellophora attinorum TaxID=1664694 RepID=A0A0N1I0J8_9EURO|nr:Regulatory protein wetA [Phialophora attinorum]KPI45045.1 Regulatory protein wetA [Phialophora attinorum]
MYGDGQLAIPMHESDEIFNEVFDQELYEGQHSDDSCELTNEVLGLYATEPLQGDYPRLPSLSGSTSQETSNESPPQPWRKGLWCLNQESIAVPKLRKPLNGTVPAPQVVQNPSFLIRSPPTPSLSPTMKTTKRFVTSPNAAKHRHKGLANLPLSRENTLSPTPMYSKLPLHAKMEQVETWQQDFKNFNIQPKGHLPSQPSVSYQDAGHFAHAHNAVLANSGTDELPLISGQDFMFHENDDGAAIDPGLINRNRLGLAVQTNSVPKVSQAPIPYSGTQQNGGLVWTTESLHSSNSSHQSSYDTLPPSLSSGMSSSGLHNSMGQTWWSPEMGPPTPGWATTPREPFPTIAAPTPKRAVTQSFADNIAQHTDGLGIHYGELNYSSDYMESNMVYPSVESSAHPLHHGQLPAGVPPVPPLPFAVSGQSFHNATPFATPRTVRRSPTRAPSPSISPLSMTPRSRRANRSPSRPDHPNHNHHRRKSIHKPGPIKTAGYAPVDNALPSASSGRARSRSQSKPPRTPKTPKTPSSAFAVDFVNFTALDAPKLISDVAPSGSSKTRARREAEAKEKSKKLSEAALKAVSVAGGDVEAVKRAIRLNQKGATDTQ